MMEEYGLTKTIAMKMTMDSLVKVALPTPLRAQFLDYLVCLMIKVRAKNDTARKTVSFFSSRRFCNTSFGKKVLYYDKNQRRRLL